MKKKVGRILTVVGLVGMGASLVLLSGISQNLWLLGGGSILLLCSGVYYLNQYYITNKE